MLSAMPFICLSLCHSHGHDDYRYRDIVETADKNRVYGVYSFRKSSCLHEIKLIFLSVVFAIRKLSFTSNSS